MKELVARLSVEEKVAQTLFLHVVANSPDFDPLMALIKKGIGGICLFGGNVFDVPSLLNGLQRRAKVPLLMASDLEDGAGQQVHGATHFPSNMALGAARSDELAYQKGRLTAVEAHALGIHLVLAPVLDTQSEPANPIINIRSFGGDPKLVSGLGLAFIRGVRDGGALSCAKHFPDHGGTKADSHLVLPQAEKIELAPFRDAASQADAVMTAHLLAPALDADYPASLSKKITQGILRGEVGFSGLVLTDALLMGAIHERFSEAQAATLALNAGADVLLCPKEPEALLSALVQAVEKGELSLDVLDRAVERIMATKARLGLFANKMVDVGKVELSVGVKKHQEWAQKMAEAALTRIKHSELKIRDSVCVKMFDGEAPAFLDELRQRGIKVGSEAEAAARIAVLLTRPRAFKGSVDLPAATKAELSQFLAPVETPILVSMGNPYLIKEFRERALWLCTYSACEASQRAAAKALVGDIPCQGQLPIIL